MNTLGTVTAAFVVATFVYANNGLIMKGLQGDLTGGMMMGNTVSSPGMGAMNAGDGGMMGTASSPAMGMNPSEGGPGMMGVSSSYSSSDEWTELSIEGGDTTVVVVEGGGDSSSGNAFLAPAPDGGPVTCAQPDPKKVQILGGAKTNRGILVEGPNPDRTEDVRKKAKEDFQKLADEYGAKFQKKEAPYANETPLACPDTDKCQLTVTNTFTTDPDPIKVTYKTDPKKMYEADATATIFVEGNCTPKS